MKKKICFLFFLFSCFKAPHKIGWYLTLRIPAKVQRTTIGEELQKSEKYKIIADSIFNLQEHLFVDANISVPGIVLSDTLRRFLPRIIDTTKSDFGSLLFLIYAGAKYKGEVRSAPAVIRTEIKGYYWDDTGDTFALFGVKDEVDTFSDITQFSFTKRIPFLDFPAGPHLFIVTPILETGAAFFDSIITFKEALFGARILGDNVVTFIDTIKNDNQTIIDAAKENRIKRIFLHLNIKHSFPVRVYLNLFLISARGDMFKPIDSLMLKPAPKNQEGVSVDSTEFSFDIEISKDMIDLAKDSVIFYKAQAIADSQGNVFIKPDDFVKLKGYLGVTIYTLPRKE